MVRFRGTQADYETIRDTGGRVTRGIAKLDGTVESFSTEGGPYFDFAVLSFLAASMELRDGLKLWFPRFEKHQNRIVEDYLRVAGRETIASEPVSARFLMTPTVPLA